MSVVEVEEADGFLIISLNRPERRNAVSEELYHAVADGLERATAEGKSVVVLRGNGKSFCAGADLKAHAQGRTRHEQRVYVLLGQLVAGMIESFEGVVLTSVHGHAIGAGAELAVAGDLMYVTDDAQVRFPEVALATYFGGGVTQRLPRIIGMGRAGELLLTGRPMLGSEAASSGLAAASFPTQAEMEAHVREVARTLAAAPRRSLAAAKRDLARTPADALSAEAVTTLGFMGSDEWRAGVERFAEPRRP